MVASTLSNYFLSPVGLLALLGLAPLIAFYYFRPKPEEKLMPSMQFFAENEKSGKIHRAYDRLMQNLLLLLHILAVIAIAAALADFTMGEGRPDEAVIVLDRSASMSNNFDDAKSFAKSNLGNSNTLIVVDDDLEIPLEKASATRTSRYIDSLEPYDLETDIAAGLELAQEYDGAVVVASDMDQSVSDRSPEDIIESFVSDGRMVDIMDTVNSNSWGIIDVKPGKYNSSVDIKNFEDQQRRVEIEVNGNAHTTMIEGGEVRTVTFSSSDLNQVSLPGDGMNADNNAYISIPDEQAFEVVLISDDGNPYLETALDLIEFTDVRTVSPPVNGDLDADVYIVGETDRMLTETMEEIETQVNEGASLVLFTQPHLEELQVNSVPGELGRAETVEVEIEEPQRINVGQTTSYELNMTNGDSLSHPDNAMVRSQYGEGEVLLYNIRDEDFRYNFLYPIFWKDMMEDLTGRPSIDNLNVRTGETINETWIRTPDGEEKQGEAKINKAGFYNTTSGVYAANLASAEESQPAEEELDIETGEGEGNKSLKQLIVLLLVGIALAELIYLRHAGDI